MKDKEMYTLKELAKILDVSRQTIYNNMKRGKITATKYGKEYRISKDQLNNIIKNGYK